MHNHIAAGHTPWGLTSTLPQSGLVPALVWSMVVTLKGYTCKQLLKLSLRQFLPQRHKVDLTLQIHKYHLQNGFLFFPEVHCFISLDAHIQTQEILHLLRWLSISSTCIKLKFIKKYYRTVSKYLVFSNYKNGEWEVSLPCPWNIYIYAPWPPMVGFPASWWTSIIISISSCPRNVIRFSLLCLYRWWRM